MPYLYLSAALAMFAAIILLVISDNGRPHNTTPTRFAALFLVVAVLLIIIGAAVDLDRELNASPPCMACWQVTT